MGTKSRVVNSIVKPYLSGVLEIPVDLLKVCGFGESLLGTEGSSTDGQSKSSYSSGR